MNNEYEYAVFKTDCMMRTDTTTNADAAIDTYLHDISDQTKLGKIALPVGKYIIIPILPIKVNNQADSIKPQQFLDSTKLFAGAYPTALSTENYIGHFTTFMSPCEISYLATNAINSKSKVVQNPCPTEITKEGTIRSYCGFLY
jgi:hypothetical protein